MFGEAVSELWPPPPPSLLPDGLEEMPPVPSWPGCWPGSTPTLSPVSTWWW